MFKMHLTKLLLKTLSLPPLLPVKASWFFFSIMTKAEHLSFLKIKFSLKLSATIFSHIPCWLFLLFLQIRFLRLMKGIIVLSHFMLPYCILTIVSLWVNLLYFIGFILSQ